MGGIPETRARDTQRITPNIWCNGNAEEVGAAIAEVFTEARVAASTAITARYPREDLPDFQQPLADGGTVRMPLQAYPFSAQYGWIEDRFGINWQLMLTDPEGQPRPFIIPSLLFSQRVQGKAEEAGAFYRETFSLSAPGNLVRYPQQTGPAAAGEVMFSDFQLLNQWFTAMDSGAEGAETFSPGFSLSVQCRDQTEIDHYWGTLSAYPEHEQCGWLSDKFGVSWQIVPANMDELMARPNAYRNQLGMKKLVIDDF